MRTTFITDRLGPVDELTMAKILEIEPTEDDIVEVHYRLDGDDDLGLPAPNDRVARILHLVTPLVTEWEDALLEA